MISLGQNVIHVDIIRTTIFIGSSSEGLEVAKAVKSLM
jgi:hypothetical protein